MLWGETYAWSLKDKLVEAIIMCFFRDSMILDPYETISTPIK